MSPRDPWLAQRLHAVDRQRRAEARVFAGVIEAMTVWLDTARALVLGQPLPPAALRLLDSPPALTAAAEPDIDAVRGAAQVWARGVAEHVDPALSEAFGEGFLDAARRADISPLPFQLDYLEQVHDRLRIWPEGAFEELRPELLEMLSEGMDYDQMTERIGRILNIDAPTRRIRGEISEIDRQLADPELSRADKAALRARKRELWGQHDESLQQWQWLARRIARTETHGAIEGGALAAAQAVAAAGGTATYKRWLATTDERTRGTHVIADGQMVKLHEAFQVGRAHLQHPGEAGGPPGEVIQCRCTTLYLREDEVQDALQGAWGGRGVGPGHARIGPDDPDDADAALQRWKREQRGENLDDQPGDGQGEDHPDETTPPAPSRITAARTRPSPNPRRSCPTRCASGSTAPAKRSRPTPTHGTRPPRRTGRTRTAI
ncbi:phage minor head protein [Nocardia sp. NPDC004711]